MVGPVLAEVQLGALEDGDEPGEAVDFFFAGAQLGAVVEVGEVGEVELVVGVDERGDDVLVDAVADVGLALEGGEVGECGAGGHGDAAVGLAGVFVADVFEEQQHEDVVLVVAGVHAAAEGVAAGPERGVEVGFFDGHG